jgi:hypothetical protein
MITDDRSESAGAAAKPFASLMELMAQSDDLRRRYHASGSESGVDRKGSLLPPEILATARELIDRGQATGRVLLSHADRLTAQNVLDYWLTVFYREKQTPPDATLAAYDRELAKVRPKQYCPFLGLEARIDRAPHPYYGREEFVNKLLERLRDRPGLLPVLGPDDGDKGLVVLGGLLPELIRGNELLPDSTTWHILPVMTPSAMPLENLAREIVPPEPVHPEEWVTAQVEGFRKDAGHLTRMLARISKNPCVLIVDRFEEVLGPSDPDIGHFLENLAAMSGCGSPAHVVILIMRSDVTHRVARWQEFNELFTSAQQVVPPLSASDLREAIQRPSACVGLLFEDGVIEAIVQDVLGEPAGLPLLQFFLVELWEGLEGNLIRWNDYRRLKNPREAMAASVERFYGALDSSDRAALRQIFLLLARPGVSGGVILRRQPINILSQGDPARIARLLRELKKARLVRIYRRQGGIVQPDRDPAQDDLVELTHDALVNNWPRGVQWMESARYQDRQLQLLKAASELWREHGKDPGGLIAGSLLEEALKLGDQGKLAPLEAEFVAASRLTWEERERRKDEERRRELHQERTHSRKLWRLLIALSVMFLIALVELYFLTYHLTRRQRVISELKKVQEKLATRNTELKSVNDQLTEKDESNKSLIKQLSARVDTILALQSQNKALQSKSNRATVVSPLLARDPEFKGHWRLWRNGKTLRVHFLDGSEEIRKLVAKYGSEWSRYANLKFNFDSKDNDAEIRVTFSQPGSWSARGTDALTVAKDRPTSNMGLILSSPDEEDQARIIRHEFGHIIGLIHEQQSPNADIKWNKAKVLEYYTGPPNNWSVGLIEDTILKKLPEFKDPPYRPFDPKSIMMFPIQEGLANITVGWNMTLSDSDKKFAAQLYPPE